MNAQGQMVCLSMIVKNEAPVIRRCLDSVRPILDHWVIVDTGSTDGTQEIIREHLRDLPGELHERPWRDFAFNRSEALNLARGKGDYTLIIDADDTLEIVSKTGLPALTADSYMVTINDTIVVYQRPQLVRSALPWRYEGVLHEFITCEQAAPPEQISAIVMRRNHDGARRKDPTTYQRDAAVLEAALRTETNPFLLARYRFYLAQSYRDSRQPDKALSHYLARAELGYWQEEVFISLYWAARLKEQLGHPDPEVIAAYLRASDALPTRAEALHQASRFCRERKRYEEGYQLAKRGLDIRPSSDALFIESDTYEGGLLDEFALNAYWSGHYRECVDANLKILKIAKLAAADMQRVVDNAVFASAKLPRDPDLGTFGAETLVEQHKLKQPRRLRSRTDGSPRVFAAIIAEQEETSLPLYLHCIESLDYPKSSIVLWIHASASANRIVRDWVDRVGELYAGVEFETEEVGDHLDQHGVHERNAKRSRVLGRIRNASLRRARMLECDFYFVADVDNFVRPCTLRELVALDLPIVAPFLRSVEEGDFYSNYHAEVDVNGYYKACDQYSWILDRRVRGVLEVPVVKGTYLIRNDVLNELSYDDGTSRHEYVIFSEGARQRGTPQYLDNRQVYGYVLRAGDPSADTAKSIERAKELLSEDLRTVQCSARWATLPTASDQAPLAAAEARAAACEI